ncbi:bacterioferritin-associated ferredoxin [Neomegalonema sp.]|uniref:(2Fe-2S)-binding protein n=1 Tax=Neomegalonema sp. TaxID=2039713 RepID=UPI00345BE1D8
MIVCSCAVIDDRAIRSAVETAAADGGSLTCAGVYKHLGKRPRCGNCRPLMMKIIDELHARGAECPYGGAPCAAAGIRQGECHHEGRRQSHRAPEQGAPQRIDGREPVLASLPAA